MRLYIVVWLFLVTTAVGQTRPQDQVSLLFARAQESVVEQEWARAESELRQVLGIVLVQLGAAFHQAGEKELAEKALAEASRAAVLTDRALVSLIQFYALTGQYSEGLESVQLLLEINPIHPVGRHLLGVLQILDGQPDAASHSLRDAYIASEKNADVGFSLGYSYLAQDDLENAEGVFQELLGNTPVRPGMVLRIGRALLETGHPKESLLYLRRAVEENPKDSTAAHYLREGLQESGDLGGVQADVPALGSNLGDAVSVLLEGLEAQRQAAASTPQLIGQLRRSAAFAYGKLGEVEMKSEKLERASTHFGLALDWDESLSGTYMLLGLCYSRQGRIVQAGQAFAECIRKDNTNLEARQFLSQIAVQLAQQGEPEHALESVDLLLSLDPSSAYLMVLRGRIRAEMGEFEKALVDFSDALEQDSSIPEAHYNSGVLLLKLERAQEALDQFDRELTSNPDHEMAIFRKAVALTQLDRDDEANTILDSILGKNQRFAGAYALRAQIYLKRSQITLALANLETAATLEPEGAEHFRQLAVVYRKAGRISDAEKAQKRFELLTAGE